MIDTVTQILGIGTKSFDVPPRRDEEDEDAM